MSQIPGSYAPDDVPEGSIDNSQRGQERQQNNDDYVAMKGSTSIGIPNPTGAKLVDTNPSPPNPWENKSPFDVNTGTEPWDSVKNEKPEEVGPVVEDDSLPRNVAVQPQGEHHQQIREGREAVKEPVDEVIGEPRATTSPEKTHSPSQNQKSQELAALAALTGGQPIHDGDSRRPYSEEERAGYSLAHGDRLAREVQHEQHPEHDRMRATGQEHEREREKEREQTHQHEKERQLARRREMEREHEVQREKEREQERRREEERERQRAQQFNQQQKGTHGEHDRARRAPSESESSNEEMFHDTQEEHPTDQNQSRLGRKKSKASATMTKAMGTLKEKVGKLVHHEKTADKGTEQKMVGDTRKKLADVNYS